MTDLQGGSRVEKFLAGVAKASPKRGNLIFALDATASREATWDAATELQAEMFREVAGLGRLDLQLAFFRGLRDVDAECRVSPWVSDPLMLSRMVTKIRCRTGNTQWAKVLDHIARESTQRKVNAAVLIGDCCEESHDLLTGPIQRVSKLGIPIFALQEGSDEAGQKAFQEIAQRTGGAFAPFSVGRHPASGGAATGDRSVCSRRRCGTGAF
jgi:hypothetical protein